MDDPGGGALSDADCAETRDSAESDDGDDFVDYGAEDGTDTAAVADEGAAPAVGERLKDAR